VTIPVPPVLDLLVAVREKYLVTTSISQESALVEQDLILLFSKN
jgi:hypothetical protein